MSTITNKAWSIALLVTCLFLLANSASAQKALELTVVDGEGAFNDIKGGPARTPVGEVKDEGGRPVDNAKVVFQLPNMNASGTFPDGSRTLIVSPDTQGRAVAAGIKP